MTTRVIIINLGPDPVTVRSVYERKPSDFTEQVVPGAASTGLLYVYDKNDILIQEVKKKNAP